MGQVQSGYAGDAGYPSGAALRIETGGLSGAVNVLMQDPVPLHRQLKSHLVNAFGRAFLLSGLVLLGACSDAADDGVVGIWSSASRTKGGLGTQWIFLKDGNVTYTFGALVDFKYEISGSRIKTTLLAPDQSVTNEVSVEEFSIDGDTLTVNPQTPDRKLVMKRSGRSETGEPLIVGDWTYTHYTGGPALMRYSRSGTVQLSVPFQTLTGTYRNNQGILSVTLRDQKPMDSKFRREKDFLILTDNESKESKYLKFEY
jgi:hypothetical protein